MCGIAGIFHQNGDTVPVNVLKRMTDSIAHRGPDSEGHYTDGPIGLGHRRLAIIDLSPSGHQPMANETGDVIITFNGEIYNFQKLRVELEACGHHFHSRTDTEAIIHAYEEWGAECVSRLNGMFAFAIWDRPRRRLFLARDRFGVKPLYWHWRNGVFIFASEIKAILRHPRVSPAVCHPALNEYFTFQNVFTDLTLFEGVRLLPAGCTLTVELDSGADPRQQRYWDYPLAPEPLHLTEEECVEQLYHLFVQAVTRQLVSDVPVGAYLSGGLDSGSITSIAVRNLERLTTFTGGFDLTSASGMEVQFDERRSAEVLANLLKTEHYEVVMHAGDMEWVLPQLIWHQEDLRVGQCYPNYYVARLAGKFVKVVLSGTGGDELFGGYPWRYYRGLNSTDSEDYFRRYYKSWQRLVPDEDKARLFTPSVRRRLGDHSAFETFRGVFAGCPGVFHSNEDYVAASLYFELKTFLHGLLVMEDKLSMAHSLETRVPFLDNDLVDFAMRVPVRYKLRNLEHRVGLDENLPGKRRLYEVQSSDGKAVLRKAMSRLIPPEVSARNKQGFSAPDASWFRGESIDYINRLLRNPKAMIYELVTPDYIGEVLDQHCSGQVNRRLLIWSLLSLEWWLRGYFSNNMAGEVPAVPPVRRVAS
ncbi:MAG TPA: asparagine synthase (glutamine-hydrolyzing) [Gemmataceae bacterium]|jgi:asparagine synthase (glutamine-hydrolysing)|nr:asparagine synthase (glutamine-hydrolyzing) [Gemmataceae bacterium]